MAPRVVFRQVAPVPISGAAIATGAGGRAGTGLASWPADGSAMAIRRAAPPGEDPTAGIAGPAGGPAPAPPVSVSRPAGADVPASRSGIDVDRLIEVLEERVLAEVERRGGRYRGMF